MASALRQPAGDLRASVLAAEPAIRTPIIAAVAIGKAAFVALLLSRPALARGFAVTVAFDTLCVVLFGAYLLGA